MTRRARVLLPLVGSGLVAIAAADPPLHLADTGFDPVTLTAFAPQYPLWSDGAGKRRWIALPPDGAVDATDPDHWDFPDDTRLWKEFSIGGRRVETRLLWKRAGTWVFASYAWNDAQTEATRVPARGLTTSVEVAPGVRHRIPSVDECRACHGTRQPRVLGFTALQLSDDRDPLALHAEPRDARQVTLRALIDAGVLTGAPAHWRQAPPRISAPDPETRAALGYLSANCGNCHNAADDLSSLGLHLHASATTVAPCAPAITTTVDQRGRWVLPEAPDTSRRLAPGAPHLSTVLARMASSRPSRRMPPLGTVVVDADAVARLTDWIAHTPRWLPTEPGKMSACLSSTTPSSLAPATMD